MQRSRFIIYPPIGNVSRGACTYIIYFLFWVFKFVEEFYKCAEYACVGIVVMGLLLAVENVYYEDSVVASGACERS